MPVKDRPGGDTNSRDESPGLKDGQETRFVSIPIGSGPDAGGDEEDEEDSAGSRDRAVERWLNNGAVRRRT